MKTTSYNPSPLEVELAGLVEELKDQFNEKLTFNSIVKIDNMINQDNPMVKLHLEDDDGDSHVVVFKIIQKPDSTA